MSRFSDLTDDQIYTSLSSMRASRKIAREAQDEGLVAALQVYINGMITTLIERNTDPHTTAADIRYFENHRDD
jgi:hypothetical protein